MQQIAPSSPRGDYVARKKEGNKPLADWTLWRLRSGEYEVESAAKNAPILQVFGFDAQFLPTGYSLKLGPLPNSPRDPDAPRSESISCQDGEQQLLCDADYDGRKSTTSIPAKKLYVFFPGEFYGLDFSWFLTGVIRSASLARAKESVVNVYTMEENEANIDEIVLKTG